MKWQQISSIQQLPKKLHILGELYQLKYIFLGLLFAIDFTQSSDAQITLPALPTPPTLTINLPEKWLALNPQELVIHFECAFESWREQQMREFIMRHANFWLLKMNTYVNAWQFKPLKATWGLCRLPSRVICLNTRLFHFSPICIKAVLVHELSHLFHANHSPHFYQHLLDYFPEYKKAKAMLRERLIMIR